MMTGSYVSTVIPRSISTHWLNQIAGMCIASECVRCSLDTILCLLITFAHHGIRLWCHYMSVIERQAASLAGYYETDVPNIDSQILLIKSHQIYVYHIYSHSNMTSIFKMRTLIADNKDRAKTRKTSVKQINVSLPLHNSSEVEISVHQNGFAMWQEVLKS